MQTGYLRTVELSLAWLFEQIPECESALQRLLTQNNGADGTRILATKDKAGHRLYKRWSESRVHKGIGRMLSDEKTPREDTSADDSGTEDSISPANPNTFEGKTLPDLAIHGIASSGGLRDSSDSSYPSKLILPPNWKRLVEIYYSYIHDWFPIVERDAVNIAASAYPPEGLNWTACRVSTSSHAQLWSVLAVSAFQDASSTKPSNSAEFSPSKIYAISHRLLPIDDENFEAPHICALLLQSLALLGQKKTLGAWILVGKAARLALHGRATVTHMFPIKPGNESCLSHAEVRILAATFVLDSLASLCLGQPQVTAGIRHSLPSVSITKLLEASGNWAPVDGLGPSLRNRDEFIPSPAFPLPTFQQIFSFCRIWGAGMDARLYDGPTSRKLTPEDLVRSLDGRFSFCNSLIFGSSTPTLPSAYLLQGMFLAITLDLVPGHRPSLFSNFVEVVDSCVQTFGSCGTPPIMVTLMQIVQRHGHCTRMHDHDKIKWDTSMEALTDVWKTDLAGRDGTKEHQNTADRVDPFPHPIVGPSFMDEISTASHQTDNRPPGTGNLNGDLSRAPQPSKEYQFLSYDSYERQGYQGNIDTSPGTTQSLYSVTPTLNFQSPVSGRQPINLMQNPSIPGQMVDYDSILEELGSIDCADSLDMDPQFMTNLGFAPGCDLGEMFHGDFGT